MKHIILSSSMTKSMGIYVCGKSAFSNEEELIKVDFCPKQVHAKYISNDKIEDNSSSLAMLQGKYFETRCLGSGRSGEVLDDLPRQNSGNKTAAHKRIDERVADFHNFVGERGLQIAEGLNTQMPLAALYSDFTFGGERYRVWLRGELDIFPTIIDYSKFCIVDLKLTKDTGNEYFDPRKPWQTSSGCWGAPWNIAKNQPLFYHYLVRNINLETVLNFHKNDLANDPDIEDQSERISTVLTEQAIRLSSNATFFYAVFGHDKKTEQHPQQKLIEYSWSKNRESTLAEMVGEAVMRFVDAEREGWKANPLPFACKHCSVKCEFKNADVKL